MKKVLIAIYFSIVIALSLSARAEMNMKLDVENINLDRASRTIQIAGRFGVPCVKNPAPLLERTSEEGVLTLSVIGERIGQACIQVVGPRVAFAIDMKALKYEIKRLGMDANRSYRIINKQGGFDEVIDFKDNALATRFSSATAAGKIVEVNGTFFLETAEKAVRLNSPFIDLASMVGHEADLFGHKIETGLSSEQTFLLSKTANSWFIVTGVSIAVE